MKKILAIREDFLFIQIMLIRRRNWNRKAMTHCSNGVAAKSIAHFVIQSEAWESPK